MESRTIPILTARGNHYEVGCQIGEGGRSSLREMHSGALEAYGERWGRLILASRPFLAATERHLPRVLDELRGAAAGSGIALDDLFLMSVEELLAEEVRGEEDEPGSGPEAAGEASSRGCSDLAAGPPATADGHVWLAHNNDLGPSAEKHLYVTRVLADGEPEIMAVTVGGIFISIGLNSAGISLTGNQLYPNDSRPGVPRLLIVRDILARTDFDSALSAALLPERASSYNNLIASEDGRIVSAEGSATDCDLLWAEGGTVVHTNNYRSAKMKRYEAASFNPFGSEGRCSRAAYYADKYRGRIGREACTRFMSDHVFAPWSVCRHSGESVTVFGAIIDLNNREMWLTRGTPCNHPFDRYVL